MINRLGEPVCPGEIVRINRALRNDRTTVVSAAFDKHYFHEVVSMKRLQGRERQSPACTALRYGFARVRVI